MTRPVTRFSTAPLWQMTRQLAAVAGGRAAADLVITDARILSTYTDRISGPKEIWLSGGRIAAVKDPGAHRSAPQPKAIYDARGGILAPGLVDPHIHIESSMITACAYAEGALLNGTTTIFCDSHEIGNVMDVAGIEAMLEDARLAPMSIFLTVPSTVPATSPELETAGGDLTPEKIGALFDAWPEAVALGEKMDFVPVVMGDPRSHAIIAESLKRGRPVSGHVYGREFIPGYAASGVTDTHEAIDREIANDMADAGIWVFLRGGNPSTPWNSIAEAIGAITKDGASPKRFCVCTDDRDADDLLTFGQDWVVREAIRLGMAPATAWAMGSLHGATRFGMDGDFGALGGGRRADVILLNDDLKVQNTWYGGELMVEGGKITPLLDHCLEARYTYPKAAYQTVKLPAARSLLPELPAGPVTVNAIGIEMPGIALPHRKVPVTPGKDWAGTLAAHSLTHVAVIERHGKSDGNIAKGFLHDFTLKAGAVASSVGHDSHNIIVAGLNEADMLLAVAEIEKHQGGIAVVRDGEVKAFVALPVAGLMSDKRVHEVAEETRALKAAWEEAGCAIPYMGFNLIPLSVIPEIRITDKGLVTVPQMAIVPTFEA
ncbi:adenine deaminase [Falsigemmobacter faecalis]|uniref:Adenine deaminase n=1 Tax=Falsigemmobacter faecalis TaxID=2488730 RepID=A0A3P3DD19_9RHOB|nr:adenine deaminase C-terminal domain-containing protein [Falsigemmobacter faecalis]RRH71516.1 adenine deaminase [Falsigemmobacter faecalis]